MEKKNYPKKRIILFTSIAVLLSAIAYLTLCAMVKPDCILPNTTINGISLDGMSLKEAANILENDLAVRQNDISLTVTAEGTDYHLMIGKLLELDCQSLAEEAFLSEQQGFLLRGGLWLKNFIIGSHRNSLPAIHDFDALHKEIADSGLLDIDSAVQTSCQEENGQLVFTMGTPGSTVDEAALIKQIESNLKTGEYDSVITCPMTDSKVDPVDIDQLYQEIHRDPVNATLNPVNGYQIVDSINGLDFDKEAARKILEEAREGSHVSIDLTYTEPDITTQDMKNHLFTDKLATWTTAVGGTAGRIINIQLAASKCNGAILCNGDEFSFNDTVGEQTAETGFQKANATQGEKVIQAYGGGICQVSTTLFIAALYAGMDIPERWCHTYVSSYAEPGMDAAVAWGDLDLRISNNKDYPVKLEVTFENGNLTATVWGTKTEVTPTEIETKVLDSSSDSLEIQTCRKIYSADRENAVISRFYSSYINPSIRQD